MLKQLLEYFTKEFIKRVGRKPQTAAEMMSIQDDAVRYLNKTKGDPKKLTPQSMINERYRSSNPFQGFTPKVIQGGKPKEGIESVIPQETFNVKSPLVQDDALRIKQGLSTRIKLNSENENAQMVKDLILRKNKEFNSLDRTQQKEILDRIQNQIKESKAKSATNVNPDDEMPFASGGMARVALGGGGNAVNWFIKNFKELLKEADNPGPWSRFSKMGSKDKQAAVADAEEMLKRLEAGDPVPEYLLDDIIADPKFSKLKGSKATDPDLAEVENLAEGYSKLKNAREKKFRGNVKDFRTGDTINSSAALDDYNLFTPTTTDMYGKTWTGKKDWIKKEIAKVKKTQKTIGPPPSSRHPNYRSMVQIRKGLEDRLTALDITEELGGNIKMLDKLRMHNYPTFKKTLDKRDWLMPPGGLKRREAFVIDIGRDTLPPKPLSKVKVSSDEYVESLDKKIMDEMDLTKSEMDNMSSTALDDLRRNADPMGMQKHFDEITEGRGVGDFAEDSSFLRDEKQTEILDKFDTTGKKGHASGGIAGQLHLNEGGRVPMIFGGSPGLRAKIALLKAGLNKGRPEKIKTLFPTYSAAEKEILRLGEKYLPKDKATYAAQEAADKAEGVQVLIDSLKHDKKLIAEQAKNKAKNDPSLDFLMESLEKTMPEAYGPHLKKYTNIDKDILQLETIKKNLIMKDRKLNAEGGRVSLSNGGLANILGV